MSLRTIIQNVCDDLGLPRPISVISSTDKQIKQLLAIANREGRELATRTQWQATVFEATLTTLAAELQGDIETIAPGYKTMIRGTEWDRTQNRPIVPLSASEWQGMKSSGIAGPYAQYRIKNNNVYAYPVPAAGNTWVFEYRSSHWCSDSTGATTRSAWANDDDIGLLDENLMELGIIWRWQKRKSLDYSEDFRSYELQVQQAITDDNAKKTLNMGGRRLNTCPPDATVPEGSWII